jgi:uncharacterized protein YciI
MKLIIPIIILVFTFKTSAAQTSKPTYDSTLAKQLGADDYGMKKYVFVILKTGENKTTDKKFIDSCFAGHLANIGKLAAQNKIVLAGPFSKNKLEMRGLFIINVSTQEEASQLLDTDPAIHAKLLTAEMHMWYGSAALPLYLKEHDKIQKISF